MTGRTDFDPDPPFVLSGSTKALIERGWGGKSGQVKLSAEISRDIENSVTSLLGRLKLQWFIGRLVADCNADFARERKDRVAADRRHKAITQHVTDLLVLLEEDLDSDFSLVSKIDSDCQTRKPELEEIGSLVHIVTKLRDVANRKFPLPYYAKHASDQRPLPKGTAKALPAWNAFIAEMMVAYIESTGKLPTAWRDTIKEKCETNFLNGIKAIHDALPPEAAATLPMKTIGSRTENYLKHLKPQLQPFLRSDAAPPTRKARKQHRG